MNVIYKISRTGPTQVGEKKANFGLEYCSVYGACFYAQRCMRLLPIFVCCGRVSSGYSTWVVGNTLEHDRSSEQLRVSLYIHSTNHVHDRETNSERVLEPSNPQKIPRLRIWHGRTHITLYREKKSWLGAGIKLRGCEGRKAPLHLNLVSFY